MTEFFGCVLTVSRKIVWFYLKLSHHSFVTRASQISIYSLFWSLTIVLFELSTEPLNKKKIKRTTCHIFVLLIFFCGFYLYCFHILCLSLSSFFVYLLFLPTLMSSFISLFYFFSYSYFHYFSIFILYIFLALYYICLFSFFQLKISACRNIT
jgi:hypothetical protein